MEVEMEIVVILGSKRRWCWGGVIRETSGALVIPIYLVGAGSWGVSTL